MIRRVFVSLVLAGLFALPASGTFAAPTNAPTSSPITVTCDNDQTYSVVTNTGNSGQHGQGQPTQATPAFVEGTNTVLVPVSLTFTGTYNGAPVFSASKVKGPGAGTNQTLTTCTFSQSSTDQSGNTFTFSGTAVVFQPAGGH